VTVHVRRWSAEHRCVGVPRDESTLSSLGAPSHRSSVDVSAHATDTGMVVNL
jgi:hypothetical protein